MRVGQGHQTDFKGGIWGTDSYQEQSYQEWGTLAKLT